MTAPPAVSVVVPVLNGATTIGELLGALCSQSGISSDTEIIVVDNGSTDATADIAQRFGVTLLIEPKPGPAAARNHGLYHARGEIIAHLDADTVPSRRWLAELVAPFADPTVQLVAGKTLCYPVKTPAERYVAASGLYDAERTVRRQPFPFAPSLNMAVRRSAALAVGGWCEDFRTGEDVDFSQRLLQAFGCAIIYRPKAVLFHRGRSTPESLRRQAWTYGEGVADLYRRYPNVVSWDWRKNLAVRTSLALASTLPLLLFAGKIVKTVSAEQIEFARYRAYWNRWFWSGFFSRYGRLLRSKS